MTSTSGWLQDTRNDRMRLESQEIHWLVGVRYSLAS